MNLPDTFNSFCIFGAYAIMSHIRGSGGMSVSQAIGSLAALRVLSSPLAQLLYAIPQGWAALGCFARVQEYLLQPPKDEKRMIKCNRVIKEPSTTNADLEDSVELETLSKDRPTNELLVRQGSFGWSDGNSDVVRDVNISLHGNSHLTIVVGPVGCGKSTFLMGLLGETSKMVGQIELSIAEVAFCDQNPWLTNGSIRENIIVDAPYDAAWYTTVCQACALDFDLQRMPDGDATAIGSKGIKLSGGQKQRIVSDPVPNYLPSASNLVASL